VGFVVTYFALAALFWVVCMSIVIAMLAIVGVVVLRRRREGVLVPVGSNDRLVWRTDVEDR
jgi:hypothetical protein